MARGSFSLYDVLCDKESVGPLNVQCPFCQELHFESSPDIECFVSDSATASASSSSAGPRDESWASSFSGIPKLRDVVGIENFASLLFSVPLFLEIFAGSAGLTEGLCLHHVLCARPWDVQANPRDDVLANGSLIILMIRLGIVRAVHLATPCQSFSIARSSALRNAVHPYGLPSLSGDRLELVVTGNRLAAWTVEVARVAAECGCYVSIENPFSSWLWELPAFKLLASKPGFGFTFVRYSDFGSQWCKPTAFLHNTPRLHLLACGGDFPEVPSISLRGTVEWGGKKVFRTALASPYPVQLCSAYGQFMAESLEAMTQAERVGQPIPLMDKVVDMGLPSSSTWLQFRPSPSLELAEMSDPLVPNGDGQPKQLTIKQQVEWMHMSTHPFDILDQKLDVDLRSAIQFELNNEPAVVDQLRAGVLDHWVRRAEMLMPQHAQWAAHAPAALRPLVRKIHGPLIGEMMVAMGYEDEGLLECLQSGFPYVGPLPACGVAVKPGTAEPLGFVTPSELRAKRQQLNAVVVRKLKASEWDGDLLSATQEDVEFGAMRGPWPLTQWHLSNVTLSRRLPVREEREGKWRTRIVDHKTESEVNCATQPTEKLSHDTIDTMATMIKLFVNGSAIPHMWKRDISKAFRRLPIQADHLALSWVTFLAQGTRMVAQHLGMPFGTTSAVHAWHRAGAFLLAAVRRLCLAPAARFVDDYFGVSIAAVTLSGGVCLDVLSNLVGFSCKPEKSVDAALDMVLLGAQVAICLARQSVIVSIDSVKADRWSRLLLSILDTRQCSQESAERLAGRLSFAVTVSLGKVGRAYVKPFYAQANDPRPGGGASWALRFASNWWVQYLVSKPKAEYPLSGKRNHVLAWTDAAGESRWLAAVVYIQGRGYLYTRMRVPDAVWAQLLPREDHQIGMQELLAVPLLLATFAGELEKSLLTVAIDNQGVLLGLIGGRAGADDLNMSIGRTWLQVADMGVGLHAVRVESAANLADGPTRDNFKEMEHFGATFVEPVMPEWVYHIWRWP